MRYAILLAFSVLLSGCFDGKDSGNADRGQETPGPETPGPVPSPLISVGLKPTSLSLERPPTAGVPPASIKVPQTL